MVRRGPKLKAEEDKVVRRNVTFTREIMAMLDEIVDGKKLGGNRSKAIARLVKQEHNRIHSS